MPDMQKPILTMRGEIKRRSRTPFWLLIAALIGVGSVIGLVITSHGADFTRVQMGLTIATLSISVPMLLGAVLLSGRVTCPKCSVVLGFKNGGDSCPSCRVSFDEPVPDKLTQ
jgi:hypothetical protein